MAAIPAKPNPSLENAISMALSWHGGQLDKSGQPFILHPLRVMLRLHSEADRIVGVLHDIIEDCDGVTLDTIRIMGYSDEILHALDLLTHIKKGPGALTYMDYIRRIKADGGIALRVKLADLADNSDPTRLAALDEDNRKFLMERYARAKAVLTKDT